MASRELIDLTPELEIAYRKANRDWLALHPDGPYPFPTCTHRSDEEQEVLYMREKNHLDDDNDGLIDESDEWRSNAKPGKSGHNKYPAEAIDIAFRKKTGGLDWSEKLFADFAVLMKLYGAKWGGDWVKLGKSKKNDTPHYYM